jgi:adenylosuccinate synthase
MGFEVKNNLFVDKRVHLITQNNLMEDSEDTRIGTTKTGNGPAYRNKYGRTGTRAENYEPLSEMIIDTYDELYQPTKICKILFEGAQGFELDIDWGDYPYVTSSHCTIGGAILNGVPPQKIDKIIGIAKAYRTYVGAKKFSDDNEAFEKICELGNEYGATTGRKRQVNWLELDGLIKASNINGVTELIINKLDVLEEVGEFKLINSGNVMNLETTEKFQSYITDVLKYNCPLLENIKFSFTPLDI